MKNQSNVINVVVGGVLVLCFLFAITWLIYWLINTQPQLFAGIIVGLIPSAITVWQYRKQAEQDHQNWLLRDRNACLVEICRLFFSLAHDSRGTNGKLEGKKLDNLTKQIKKLQPAFLAHASVATLRAWNELQYQVQNQDAKEITRRGERLFRAIRKNLGQNDKKLLPGRANGILPLDTGRPATGLGCL